MDDDSGERLPALTDLGAWGKTLGIFALMLLTNIVAFLVSFGAGVIVTLPLTIFLAFLLLRNLVPLHRFPRGRVKQGVPP